MTGQVRIAAAQVNPTVGDFTGNVHLIKEYIGRARQAGAQLVVFPRMAVCGYPAGDFLLDRAFLDAADAGVEAVRVLTDGIGVLLGAPVRDAHGALLNAALLLEDGRLAGQTAGGLPPDTDVFDEARYFVPEPAGPALDFRGLRLGVTAGGCDPGPVPGDVDLAVHLATAPYHRGVQQRRLDRAGTSASRRGSPLLYVNPVGGNDSLVFDGAGFLVNARGEPVLAGLEFEPDLLVFDTEAVDGMAPVRPDWTRGAAQVYRALVLGLRDYLGKTGFRKALVALSGGIDSAVAAALAAAALGRENVLGVTMPSRYSAPAGVDDARELARRLGIAFRVLPIETHFASFMAQMNPEGGLRLDVAEENIQARIRGSILMFIANREGHLVLTGSNKSETAIGYTTLYGDMAGGLAVLSDVSKTMVYELAAHINRVRELIPAHIIEKPPSAELRPGQLDTHSLPPYRILDGILAAYLEEGCTVKEIVARGYEEPLTRRIIRLVRRAEFKRQQAAPCLRVTTGAFGCGRRYPIAHRWLP